MYLYFILEQIWNKLSKITKRLIGFNAYKQFSNEDNLISNYAETLSMMHWSELDKQERKTLEEYTKGY